MSERDDAIRLANAVLDKPFIDPDGDISMLARQFLRAIERETSRPIETALKDGTPILIRLKNPIPRAGRPDLDVWGGATFVARHPGLADDGFDIGWNIAAPVGHGGFPDDWIECWWPLPTPPLTSGGRPGEPGGSGNG